MEAPRPVERVTYTLLGAGDARRRDRHARLRRLVPRVLVVLLLVGLPVHALANTSIEVGDVHVVRVPLDRDFERAFTWRVTAHAAAPAGAWVWPTLHFTSGGIGNTELRDLEIPRLHVETFVDGEPVTMATYGGEFGGWRVSGHEVYGCEPHYACDWPERAWGFRDVEVEVRARVVHEAEPRGRGLVHEYEVGPMLVIMDRCPCIKSLY